MSDDISVAVNSDNQILVRVGEDERTGDTWYLGLQQAEDMPDERDVRGLARQLLSTWIAAISALQDGEITWLPFDFSDEYTRWLACSRSGSGVVLRFGWSPVEGWAVNPFDAAGFVRAGRDFRLDEAAANNTAVYRPFLLSRLRSCMCRIAHPAG